MRVIKEIYNNKGSLVKFKSFAEEYYTYHRPKWTNYFDNSLQGLFDLLGISNPTEQQFINLLIDNFGRIIKALPHELPTIINLFDQPQYLNLIYHNNRQTIFGKRLKEAFQYSKFRSSAKASWFCEKLNTRACLYCNAQFALMIGKDGNKKKLLFQLDHFYSRTKYPYLSLSLGNLIPSCSTCNISKSKADFDLTTHVHPFHEDANAMFKFKVNEENILQYLLNNPDKDLLTPELEFYDNRMKDHSAIFEIENIYKKHTDIVEELILKSIYYNKSKREELIKQFDSLAIDNSMLDRFILGNYSLDSEINKRPLAKLSKDIGQQLKLIR